MPDDGCRKMYKLIITFGFKYNDEDLYDLLLDKGNILSKEVLEDNKELEPFFDGVAIRCSNWGRREE